MENVNNIDPYSLPLFKDRECVECLVQYNPFFMVDKNEGAFGLFKYYLRATSPKDELCDDIYYFHKGQDKFEPIPDKKVERTNLARSFRDRLPKNKNHFLSLRLYYDIIMENKGFLFCTNKECEYLLDFMNKILKKYDWEIYFMVFHHGQLTKSGEYFATHMHILIKPKQSISDEFYRIQGNQILNEIKRKWNGYNEIVFQFSKE